MAENKTKETEADVLEFIDTVEPEKKKADTLIVLEMMNRITKVQPKMWGTSIIGYGTYHYKYDSGREGDAPLLAFSPRKANMVLYVLTNFRGQEELLAKLGKHKTGKICLYLNKLDDVVLDVLEDIVQNAHNHMMKVYNSKS